jgi:fumarate hydratase subunit alpha
MLDNAVISLPPDVLSALRVAAERETNDLARRQLKAIQSSIALSLEKRLPVCQDTGLVTLVVDRDLASYADLAYDALVQVLETATRDARMRANVVDPLSRKNTGTNTGLRQPELILDDRNGGGGLRILLKGAGSENYTSLRMMVPTASLQDIFKQVLSIVVEAGGKVCPPTIIGVGIGGSAVKAVQNSKLALLRRIGERNPDPQLAVLEESLLAAVNALGIGTMGLGGDTTALDVKVESAGTHTATLPVVVTFGCWANRHSGARLRNGRLVLEA